MVSPPRSDAVPTHSDPLYERIKEMWAKHDRLIAAGIDPDAGADRIAEEVFGSPEATAVLLDYLKATDEGRRWEWLYDANKKHLQSRYSRQLRNWR